MKTGFARFDRKVGGLRGADLLVLAGSPSMGKTALALAIAANVSLRRDSPPGVALFSMAADKHEVMTRLIASQARVSLAVAKTGLMPRSKWNALTDAAAKLSDSTLYIDDSSKLTVPSIRGRCERLSNALHEDGRRLGLVIIDFLQLIQGAQRLKPGVCGKAAARGARVMLELKRLAVDLRVPVIILSQIRSAAPANLKSCEIPPQADIVAFVRQGPVPGKAALIVAKNPRGRTGSIPLKFSKDLASFTG